jgi:hypothetical protein
MRQLSTTDIKSVKCADRFIFIALHVSIYDDCYEVALMATNFDFQPVCREWS